MDTPKISSLGSSFFSLPSEIRRKIYFYYFLSCRRMAKGNLDLGTWPDPDLLGSNNYILVSPQSGLDCDFNQERASNVFCVSREIYLESQEVFFSRFILCFSVFWNKKQALEFTIQLSTVASSKIRHLAFAISFSNGNHPRDLRNLMEANTLLVSHLHGLRSVFFQLHVWSDGWPSSEVDWSISSLMETFLAVARPFKDVRGLKIRWVGLDLGEEVAKLCEERTVKEYDWPWTKMDEMFLH